MSPEYLIYSRSPAPERHFSYGEAAERHPRSSCHRKAVKKSAHTYRHGPSGCSRSAAAREIDAARACPPSGQRHGTPAAWGRVNGKRSPQRRVRNDGCGGHCGRGWLPLAPQREIVRMVANGSPGALLGSADGGGLPTRPTYGGGATGLLGLIHERGYECSPQRDPGAGVDGSQRCHRSGRVGWSNGWMPVPRLTLDRRP